MTAINIMLAAGGAYLFCDSKAVIAGIGSESTVKCLPVPHINAAIATRGHIGVLPIALSIAANCVSIDELRAKLGDSLQVIKERQSPGSQFYNAMTGDFEVFVVGHDQRHGPIAFAVFSHGKHKHPAWKAMDIEQSVITPVITDSDLRRVSRAVDGVQAMVAVMQVQADIRRDVVGGHIHVTIVAEDGIHTSILGKLQVSAPLPRQPLNVKLPDVFAKHLSKAS